MRSRQSNTTIHLSRLHACLELAKALCGQVIANVGRAGLTSALLAYNGVKILHRPPLIGSNNEFVI